MVYMAARAIMPGLLGLACAVVLTACSPPPPELEQRQSAVFANGDFEAGTAGSPPAQWTVQTYLNPTGFTAQTPQTLAGLMLTAGGNALSTSISATNQNDLDLGPSVSLRVCRYGSQCARVNYHSNSGNGNGKNVNSLSQSMTIGAGDVDPLDGQVHVRFVSAPVLQNPTHPLMQQPYYFIQLTNVTQNAILYTDFNVSAQPGVPWKSINSGTPNEIDYLDWSLVDIAPGPAKLAMGDMVKLEIFAAGCQPGAHFGEIYVDGVGATIPGLNVSGSGPAQANPGASITYNLTYKNGSAAAATSVVIHFTLPPGTTFQSLVPPGGATCMAPATGAAGTITCTLPSPLAAGDSGSFKITVNIDPAATGQVTAGNYDIASMQETPLIGNKINTLLGCTLDTDCLVGNWCNQSGKVCNPQLANGVAIPSDPAHTAPALNQTCTAAAALLVCQSGVCDAGDNLCGYPNGSACTDSNASTLCRSGMCGMSGTCQPSSGCNADADCTGIGWCNESTHVCSPTLENGVPVPNDSAHTNPTLDGTCTMAAAALTCTSGVCDPADNLCGFANGNGACVSLQPSAICRSGLCGSDGSCATRGGLAGDGFCDYTAPRDSGSKTLVLLLALATCLLTFRRRQVA